MRGVRGAFFLSAEFRGILCLFGLILLFRSGVFGGVAGKFLWFVRNPIGLSLWDGNFGGGTSVCGFRGSASTANSVSCGLVSAIKPSAFAAQPARLACLAISALGDTNKGLERFQVQSTDPSCPRLAELQSVEELGC